MAGGGDTDVTFLARFCDSYSVGNNYCYFSTSHPELFAIYFEAEIDNHGKIHIC
jgi:hypothetical protein